MWAASYTAKAADLHAGQRGNGIGADRGNAGAVQRPQLAGGQRGQFGRAQGVQVGAVTTLLDITNDKLAQLRSWQSDLTWRLMFDCSPVAQMLLRPLAAITSVNERFVELRE